MICGHCSAHTADSPRCCFLTPCSTWTTLFRVLGFLGFSQSFPEVHTTRENCWWNGGNDAHTQLEPTKPHEEIQETSLPRATPSPLPRSLHPCRATPQASPWVIPLRCAQSRGAARAGKDVDLGGGGWQGPSRGQDCLPAHGHSHHLTASPADVHQLHILPLARKRDQAGGTTAPTCATCRLAVRLARQQCMGLLA